ncbi:heavy metal translocating P-type ATPase [Prevotella sp. KH2C16]|uniref:heavy metal translocating P-type ATPase n=1 Tax=Prevotella sp. KH2C16 TaxID=1855325 RepID=UPI0008EA34FE|nr:heavy metal translocating P-type ATPase [Prevotella sp. KH2C16]SFF97498.1 Cd2+/Zn2+-exporting ATPase [Prevotella sp. KH2C16]
MNKKLLRIILTAILLFGAWLVEEHLNFPMWGILMVYLVPYLLISYDVLAEAWEGICKGDPFDEDFLMSIATLGALLIGFLPGAENQFLEAVFVMLFFQVGELFEDYAEDKSRGSISDLMDIRPDTANVERNGEVLSVSPETVGVGECIIVRPGERIPLDGVVIEGRSSLNTVALTGESLPRDVSVGDEVVSGCVNISGVLKVQTTKVFNESTASKIISLVENAGKNKSKSESFITRFARVYTPIVVFLALALAFIPPFFADSYTESFSVWLYRALTFLVVSCPCALVISVPLTFFGGIGGAARRGILVKGGNYMDTLAKAGIVVFDKTGTLTKGVFSVNAVHPERISDTELLHMAAHVERYSTHPIAAALRQAYPDEPDNCSVEDVEEVAGNGIHAMINGKLVGVGNAKLMAAQGVQIHECEQCKEQTGTTIHVSIDGEYAGHIVISDEIKADSREVISRLKGLGVEKVIMLTGDRREVGASVAGQLGLDEYQAELLPTEKVSKVEEILRSKPAGQSLVFVGDGINDAPVLARADVGIAMGGLGSDAAIEAADVVLMDDKPSKLATAIKIARRTIGIARQNVAFAISVKVAVLILATFGLATMGMAVFADVGVMVLAVLNAMRTLRA